MSWILKSNLNLMLLSSSSTSMLLLIFFSGVEGPLNSCHFFSTLRLKTLFDWNAWLALLLVRVLELFKTSNENLDLWSDEKWPGKINFSFSAPAVQTQLICPNSCQVANKYHKEESFWRLTKKRNWDFFYRLSSVIG